LPEPDAVNRRRRDGEMTGEVGGKAKKKKQECPGLVSEPALYGVLSKGALSLRQGRRA